ncbi:MAG: hypothetical protein JSV76_06000 [Candidatus Bathyarchaeota archaeon]|nr:MAG: hypothetical protein JSV76_06000 [Candidatus Bathyarchaeota archaeon]
MRKTSFISVIAVFASLTVVLDAIIIPELSSGVWFGLVFLIAPITGIVLGPAAGFLSTFIGVMIGHLLIPRGIEEFLFTIGAPIGAAIVGLLFQHRWKTVFFYYTFLLASYFLTPVAWQLPVWGMWDVYCAYFVLIASLVLKYKMKVQLSKSREVWLNLALSAFVGLEADVLFRIFILIPGGTYHSIYGLPIEMLQIVWVAGAFYTPIKVAISILLTTSLGPRLLAIRSVNEQIRL